MQIVLASIFTVSSILYLWHKLLNKKIDFRSTKLYFLFLILMIFSIVNYTFTNAFIRILIYTIFLVILFYFYFKTQLRISIITPIFGQMIIMLSEMLFAIFLGLFFKYDGQDIVNTQFGMAFSNFLIALLNFVIVNIPFIKKVYLKFLSFTDKLKGKYIIVLSLFFMIVANVLAGILYYEINFTYFLVFNTFVTIICLCIIAYSYKTKNNYNKVYDKYNTTLNTLKEYELILDKFRISNHENKNQLLTIRNMITKDSDVKIYIDNIINNKLKDDINIMNEASKIPLGGLRGLIYSKLLEMKKYKIKYSLIISKEIKIKSFIEKEELLMLDICKIIGVFLDNAIEESNRLKNKNICIEIYNDKKSIIIAVSNKFLKNLDLNKISEKGYSTKGKGRGLGLHLVEEIISSNSKLKKETEVVKDIIKQKLIIKK